MDASPSISDSRMSKLSQGGCAMLTEDDMLVLRTKGISSPVMMTPAHSSNMRAGTYARTQEGPTE
jgi:hypothetical protein